MKAPTFALTTALMAVVIGGLGSEISQPDTNTAENLTCAEEGPIPDPTDCRKFYVCILSEDNDNEYYTIKGPDGFIMVPYACPSGTVYFPLKQNCDWYDGDDCPAFLKCLTPGPIPDLGDCRNFHVCIENGQNGFDTVTYTCPNGTIYFPEKQACDFYEGVGCPLGISLS